MSRIFLSSVEVCDENKVPLPYQNSGYPASFSTTNPGKTAMLNLKVICTVVPDFNIQCTFQFDIGFPDCYRFTMGTYLGVQYTRQVITDVELFLPFQLSNVKPLAQCLPCDLRLRVRETISTFQTPPMIVRIYGS